jgi:hypothetical protein
MTTYGRASFHFRWLHFKEQQMAKLTASYTRSVQLNGRCTTRTFTSAAECEVDNALFGTPGQAVEAQKQLFSILKKAIHDEIAQAEAEETAIAEQERMRPPKEMGWDILDDVSRKR